MLSPFIARKQTARSERELQGGEGDEPAYQQNKTQNKDEREHSELGIVLESFRVPVIKEFNDRRNQSDED